MSNLVPIADALADAEVFTDGDWIESKDQDPDGDVRLAQLADIGDGVWIDKSARFLTSEKAKQLRCTYLEPGDLLVARMPDPLGRCCVFPGDPMPCVTVVDVCVIRPNQQKIDNRYLMQVINSPHGRQGIARHMTGTTRQRVSRKNLGKVQIPLPPLAEQKQIAGILGAADALRAKRRESLAQLGTLLQSTFLDIFGDPVTNPMGWDDSVNLGEVADIISGLTKGRKLNGQTTREVPYLAVVNVQDRHLVLDPLKRIQATESEIQRYRLKNSDLLMTEGGDPDKLGRGTLWRDDVDECIHQNHVFRVRLHDDGLEPVFLNWLVGSERGKRYFFRQAKQTTGIATINLSQLRKFPLLRPSLDLQRRFAAIVESVEQQKAHQRAHLAELDALFASLQQRVFNGGFAA